MKESILHIARTATRIRRPAKPCAANKQPQLLNTTFYRMDSVKEQDWVRLGSSMQFCRGKKS
jgi:hypothetical protein